MAQYGKESAHSAEDPGSIPEQERSPREGNGNPLHNLAWDISWTEEPGGHPMDIGVHGVPKNQI